MRRCLLAIVKWGWVRVEWGLVRVGVRVGASLGFEQKMGGVRPKSGKARSKSGRRLALKTYPVASDGYEGVGV
jgi:hypothetical protein